MCKPGQPCPGAEEAPTNAQQPSTYDAFMSRLEMIVVGVELHHKLGLDVPLVAVKLFDAIGPIVMVNLGKKMGWSELELASHVMRERRRVYVDQGMPPPAETPIEAALDVIADIEQAIRAKANGASGAAPKAAS
jgi:hypothetical protein